MIKPTINNTESLATIALFCAGIIFIVFEISLRNYNMGQSVATGMLAAINYQMINKNSIFATILLFLLCAVQDSYESIIPFLTLLSVFLSNQITKILLVKFYRTDTASITSLIEFIAFYCLKIIIISFVLLLFQRKSLVNISSIKIITELLYGLVLNVIINKVKRKYITSTL
ncbi:MAG: hypothetical protein JJW01_00095 [Alphaproteobacteria bacterium]|nr:hypothetical protein [Rickettsiales bacterium]